MRMGSLPCTLERVVFQPAHAAAHTWRVLGLKTTVAYSGITLSTTTGAEPGSHVLHDSYWVIQIQL